MAAHVEMRRAHARLLDSGGVQKGYVSLWQPKTIETGQVVMRVHAMGLSRGKHGFHAHFAIPEHRHRGGQSQLNGHFRLKGEIHGALNQRGSHRGDFGNITAVGAEGRADATLTLRRVSLDPESPYTLIGKMLVVHERSDDLGEFAHVDINSATSGNSGKVALRGSVLSLAA